MIIDETSYRTLAEDLSLQCYPNLQSHLQDQYVLQYPIPSDVRSPTSPGFTVWIGRNIITCTQVFIHPGTKTCGHYTVFPYFPIMAVISGSLAM